MDRLINSSYQAPLLHWGHLRNILNLVRSEFERYIVIARVANIKLSNKENWLVILLVILHLPAWAAWWCFSLAQIHMYIAICELIHTEWVPPTFFRQFTCIKMFSITHICSKSPMPRPPETTKLETKNFIYLVYL